ncbi:hypothetical protein [Solibacillus sp. CAU 1738]|uniref:hypothetical protein n=1 Tax=Solibacillus sp. CAU 1738 TaxID=3140363 RepID=UPI00326098A9
MKKMIALLLTSIFLIGCQDPKVETEQEKVSNVDTRTVYESNSKPRYIQLHLKEVDYGLNPILLSYCWNEDLANCPTELKILPDEDTLDGQKRFILPPNTNIPFIIDSDPQKTLPFPNNIELFLVEDEALTPVTITNDSFTLPQEEGSYTYVFKTTYNEDIKGIAFYGFHLRVRN